MSLAARTEPHDREGDPVKAAVGRAMARCEAFQASFDAVSRSQDAPRVSSANNLFFAMTRLASPNRLNSCASFLARPL